MRFYLWFLDRFPTVATLKPYHQVNTAGSQYGELQLMLQLAKRGTTIKIGSFEEPVDRTEEQILSHYQGRQKALCIMLLLLLRL